MNKGNKVALDAIAAEIKASNSQDTVLDPVGRTALILFAQKENHAGVTMLVKMGADFN